MVNFVYLWRNTDVFVKMYLEKNPKVTQEMQNRLVVAEIHPVGSKFPKHIWKQYTRREI